MSALLSRPPRPPRRLLHMLRHDERGVLDIELVGFIPALVIVLLLLLQGFLAVSTVTSTSAAARDGARAAMLGHTPVGHGRLRQRPLRAGDRTSPDRPARIHHRAHHRDTNRLFPGGLTWH